MSKEYVYDLRNGEVWRNSRYECFEECKEEGIEDALSEGLPTFFIGECENIVPPTIDGFDIIESLQNTMYDMAGEVSEDYLNECRKEDIEELANRLQNVFEKWCEENDIDYDPKYGNITNVREVKYCAYCKKVINDDEPHVLVKNIPNSEEKYYYHEHCEFIPASHLEGAVGNSI